MHHPIALRRIVVAGILAGTAFLGTLCMAFFLMRTTSRLTEMTLAVVPLGHAFSPDPSPKPLTLGDAHLAAEHVVAADRVVAAERHPAGAAFGPGNRHGGQDIGRCVRACADCPCHESRSSTRADETKQHLGAWTR